MDSMVAMRLDITLATAGALGLVYLVLSARVIQGRFQHQVSLGDGGKQEMLARIRTHGNFSEYVPFVLILLGLLELSGANRTVLAMAGGSLVAFRILHAIGIPRKAPNPFRFLGVIGTFLLLLGGSVWALIIAFGQ
ncbi:MAG: MAPEG family protein [Rhodospirillaceae bacterium]|nr:MAPEG family protein [Rhodospirillaceae bacterium]